MPIYIVFDPQFREPIPLGTAKAKKIVNPKMGGLSHTILPIGTKNLHVGAMDLDATGKPEQTRKGGIILGGAPTAKDLMTFAKNGLICVELDVR